MCCVFASLQRCLPLRQDMVSVRPACGNQFIPDRLREWNVYEAVGMHMADLASRQAILRSAEAMRVPTHSWPVLYTAMELFTCVPNWHQTPIFAERILGPKGRVRVDFVSWHVY